MSKLSVIIPTYNRSRLVTEAIDSVLSQRCDHAIEVIVVDDGSADDTRAVLESYGDRIRYRHQPNQGMNAARNHGVRLATGDYVAFLDSDDAWLPFKAALQIAVLERLPHVGFAFSNFYTWRGSDRIADGLGKWMVAGTPMIQHCTNVLSSDAIGIGEEAEPFRIGLCEIYRLSLDQPVVLPSTSILRREVVEAMGPLPEDNWMCGDWEYFARASKRFGAAYIEKETALNRSHDDAVRLMRRDLTDRTRQRIESIERIWKADGEFLSRHRDDVVRAEVREWATLFRTACHAGDWKQARAHLERIGTLAGHVPWELRLRWWAARTPGVRTVIATARRAAR